VEGYGATMWLLSLWKEISGQYLDALLVTDSEILQQKAVSTALPAKKRLRIYMALLSQGFIAENTAWCGRARRATWRIH
jgi:hypothetical protein